MNVLIIGGMHGNEPLGLELVKLIKKNPIKNVDAIVANKQATLNNCRYVKYDLNRSFPGDDTSEDYETSRAAEILSVTKKYDIVLDFHNTCCPDNDCAFIGEGANVVIDNVAQSLGLTKVIVADYDCINKYADNCLSVEVSMSSPQNDPTMWYEKIASLSNITQFSVVPNLEKYRFIYRMTLADKKIVIASGQELKAFWPIDPKLARRLKVKTPAYPIFIADNFTPYNYGGILNKLN